MKIIIIKHLFNDKTTILFEVYKRLVRHFHIITKKTELCNINFHNNRYKLSGLQLCSANIYMKSVVNVLLKNDAKITVDVTYSMINNYMLYFVDKILSNPSKELIISIKNNTLLLKNV
jgi:hypothetical protein